MSHHALLLSLFKAYLWWHISKKKEKKIKLCGKSIKRLPLFNLKYLLPQQLEEEVEEEKDKENKITDLMTNNCVIFKSQVANTLS